MSKVKVLIFDDNPDNLSTLKRCLKDLNAELICAINENEVLEQLIAHEFALAIISVHFSLTNGYELALLIHKQEQNRNLPIIFLSADFSDEITIDQACARGIIDFIPTPINPKILTSKVSVFIRIYQQNLKLKENIIQLKMNEKQILLQNKLLEEKTIRDDLTGVYNRRHLNAVLTHEFNRCKRYNNDLTALFFDLDHFKGINDSMGHAFGDSVIKQFAGRIGHGCRRTDFIFRLGGEEFLALYPHTDIETVVSVIAEKIRTGCEQQAFKDTNRRKIITVSIGAASYKKHHPKKANDLISFADHAMYTAKSNGRNQIAIYDAD